MLAGGDDLGLDFLGCGSFSKISLKIGFEINSLILLRTVMTKTLQS